MSGWYPIETAPKDGTPIWVCSKPYWDATDFFFPTAFPVVASWRPYHPNAKGKECWRDAHGHKLSPKYWMPVPPDPSGSTNKVNEQIAVLANSLEVITGFNAPIEDKALMFLESMHHCFPDISTDNLKEILPKVFDRLSPEAYEMLSNVDLKGAVESLKNKLAKD